MSIGAAVRGVSGTDGAAGCPAGAGGCCAADTTINAEIAKVAEKTAFILMVTLSAHARFALRVREVLVDRLDESRSGDKPRRGTVVQVVIERRLRRFHLINRELALDHVGNAI